jgi:hypothetical protein
MGKAALMPDVRLVEVEIEGIGVLRNVVRGDGVASEREGLGQ